MAIFLGSTFPGILCCMLFHDATAADLSALARESCWEAHSQRFFTLTKAGIVGSLTPQKVSN